MLKFLKEHGRAIIGYFVTLVIMLISSALLGIAMLMLSVVPWDEALIKVLISDLNAVLLNSLPLFLIMLTLYFATGRLWISFLSTSLLSFVVAQINLYKISFRDDPFVFSDIFLVGEAGKMTSEYKLFVDIPSIIVLGAIAVLTVVFALCLKRRTKGVILRIAGTLVCVISLLTICNKHYLSNNKLYNSLWHEEFGNKWKDANQYMSRGVVYSFIRSIRDARSTPPEQYDEKQAQEILAQYESSNIPKNKKVHTISIMLEAYNDFSDFDGIEFDTDPYTSFHALQKDGYSGKLYTNIFAAGTIDTERAFLTGYSDTNIKNKSTLSHVQYFKEQGYYTEAMHPGYGWFYNRKNIDEYLGFDSFICYENAYGELDEDDLKAPMYHGMLSDVDFFESITQGLENAVLNKQKYFNFSVTYQNHGPYDTTNYSTVNYAVKKDSYTEEGYAIFNNYLSGIYKTDLAIKQLREYVDGSDEPIVLILFGDHNPWLGDNNSVYEMLGISLNLEKAEGGQNYYQTPYVIYANEAAKKALGKEIKGEGDTISPMFLMQEYFGVAGLDGSQYIKYQKELRSTYSVINKVYVNKNGKYVLKSDDADSEVLKHYRFVEYYLKQKKIGS